MRREYVVVECDLCGTTFHIRSESAIATKVAARNAGWRIEGSRRHVCPGCVARGG